MVALLPRTGEIPERVRLQGAVHGERTGLRDRCPRLRLFDLAARIYLVVSRFAQRIQDVACPIPYRRRRGDVPGNPFDEPAAGLDLLDLRPLVTGRCRRGEVERLIGRDGASQLGDVPDPRPVCETEGLDLLFADIPLRVDRGKDIGGDFQGVADICGGTRIPHLADGDALLEDAAARLAGIDRHRVLVLLPRALQVPQRRRPFSGSKRNLHAHRHRRMGL